MSQLIDLKIGNEVDGSLVSDVFAGYTFKIMGGFDKDGFAMKNGVLTQSKKRILLKKGCSMFRFKKGYHRSGVRVRKLVRGCIVSSDISVLNLKIVKKGEKDVPGLTDAASAEPKRLGPKRASKICKQFALTDIYNSKKKNEKERKDLRFLITKFAPKREVITKNGKKIIKRAKIQRLITPDRLRRKIELKHIKEERRNISNTKKNEYKKLLKSIYGKKVKNAKK